VEALNTGLDWKAQVADRKGWMYDGMVLIAVKPKKEKICNIRYGIHYTWIVFRNNLY